jgi:hypothetical protein
MRSNDGPRDARAEVLKAAKAGKSTIEVRNREIAELLRRLDEGRMTQTQCVMAIEDAIRATRAADRADS